MPTFSGLHCAIMMDVLIRVSLVLTAGLTLACMARRNAALGHAVLVAGLAAAFIVPVAMFTLQILPVPRLQLGLLSRTQYDDFGVVAVGGSRPPAELHHASASQGRPAVPIVPTQGGEARLGRWANVMARMDGPFMASALFEALLLGAIAKLTGLGLSLLRLRRIVARARPMANDQVLSMLRLIQERIPIRRPPRLIESAEVPTPFAAGVIGAYVLLPAGWAGNRCRDEMLAVLCHESAHLARRDHYVVIIQELFASVL